MRVLIRWLVSALAVMLSAYLLPGVAVSSFMTALLVALVLGILNALIRPLLFLLTLPITILTLGLFTFVLNAIMILLTAYFVPGFSVHGFLWALLFSIVMSVIAGLLNGLVND